MALMLGVGGVAVAAVVVAIVMSQSGNVNGATPNGTDGVQAPTGVTGQGGDSATKSQVGDGSVAARGGTGATGPGARTGTAGATGNTGAPPVSNPPRPGPEANLPLVETEIARWEALYEGDLTDAQRRQALRELGADLFARAKPGEQTRIYVLRAVFNYQLDAADSVVCLNARAALRGAGLTTAQGDLVQGLIDGTPSKCRSLSEAA
jgi:hypothetical protein